MWEKGARKYKLFSTCLNSYDHQSKANSYGNGWNTWKAGYPQIEKNKQTNNRFTQKRKPQKEKNTSTIQKKTIKPEKIKRKRKKEK